MSEAELDMWEAEAFFLGYTPLSFVDSTINAVNDMLFDAVDGLHRTIKRERVMEREQSNIVMNAWLAKLQHNVDKNFDKFELYVLKNIFRIPTFVDIGAGPRRQGAAERSDGAAAATADSRRQQKALTAEAEVELSHEVAELRRRVAAAKFMRLAMAREAEVLRTALAESDALAGALIAMSDAHKQCQVECMEEHVSFVVDQSAQLSAAVQQYRAARAALATTANDCPSQQRDGDGDCAHSLAGVRAAFEAVKARSGATVPALAVV